MVRYGVTFLLAVVAIGLTFMANLVPPAGGPAQGIGTIDWSVIAVACAFACLSLWGLVGVALSKLRERAQELAKQEAVISTESWHYRLNTWVNLGKPPAYVCGECEYWARLFHGLSYATGAIIALYIVYTAIIIVGWLFSARPSPDFKRQVGNEKLFGKGHQWVGPIVLALAASAAIVLTDSPTTVVSFPHWERVGLIAIWTVAAAVLLAVAVVASIWVVWPMLHSLGRNVQAFLSFILVRFVARVCRPVRFVAVT